jgi:hypothetical protein
VTEPREITDGIIQGVVFTGPIPESDADTDWQPYPHQYPRSDRQPFTDWLRDEQASYYSPAEYREQDIRPDYASDYADAIRYARATVRDRYMDENRRAYGAGLGG